MWLRRRIAALRYVVLEILMYQGVHSGFCAPRALRYIRLTHLISASLRLISGSLPHFQLIESKQNI